MTRARASSWRRVLLIRKEIVRLKTAELYTISRKSWNNFISASKTKELTDITGSLGVEEFDIFLQDGRHEVSSQVAGDALTQNVEYRGAHPYAKPRKLYK